MRCVAAGYRVSVICPRGDGQQTRQVLDGGAHPHLRAAAGDRRPRSATSSSSPTAGCGPSLLSLRVRVREGFDVIQACNPPDTLLRCSRSLYRPFGKRFVYDQHDLCPEVYASRFATHRGWCSVAARSLSKPGTYRVADHVIVTNESYREVAIGRGRRDPAASPSCAAAPTRSVCGRSEPSPELRNGRRRSSAAGSGSWGRRTASTSCSSPSRMFVHELGRDGLPSSRSSATATASTSSGALDDGARPRSAASPSRAGPTRSIATYLSTADIGLSADPMQPAERRLDDEQDDGVHGLRAAVIAYDLKETRVSAEDAAVYIEPNDLVGLREGRSPIARRPAAAGGAGRDRPGPHRGAPCAGSEQVPGYVAAFDRVLGRRASWRADRLLRHTDHEGDQR